MNIVENGKKDFILGQKYQATVKAVRMNGVSVEMPGAGSGIISTRCWGRGMERANALAAVHPGDEFDVTVRIDGISDVVVINKNLKSIAA